MFDAGQEIAHFKIIRKLGEGGMGVVYLAEDQKLGRNVAIKVLLGDIFDDEEKRARFDREARTAAKINHPNVMAIYEIGTAKKPNSEDEISYIVMEHIEGQSLKNYVDQKSPDLAQLTALAEKIATGLSAAHKLNIVHRDIKPDNIIVTSEGEPKILDFGLAKLTDSILSDDSNSTATISQELTRAGKILGTVSYMSPEQARGEGLDSRSDVFSFGILLYRLVSGELPFAGETQVSTLAKILESKHEPLHNKLADCPQELERIIDKCLQKNPGDRYQDTRDLVVDLRGLRRQFDSGLSESITGVTSAVKKSKGSTFTLRNTVIIAVVALIAIFSVVKYLGGSGSGNQAGSGLVAAENSLAIIGFENKTGDDEYKWLETGLPEILLTDLAQVQSIKIISQSRILDYLGKEGEDLSHEARVKAAKRLGATNILSGSFYKLGSNVRIDARLEETATGTIVFAEKVMGEDPFLLVDSLTDKIASSLNIESQMIAAQSVSQLTTSSPQAYKLYLEGMNLFLLDDNETAIKKFEEAIAIDSTFALPYLRIGMSYTFQGKQTFSAQYFKLAKKYEHKLPQRERTMVDIYADLWLNSEYNNAMIKIKSFVENYPDDKEGRAIYGLLVGSLQGDSALAFAQVDTALQLDPAFPLAFQSAMQIASNHRDYNRNLEIAEAFIKANPKLYTAHAAMASALLALQRYDESKQKFIDITQRFPDEAEPHSRLAEIYLTDRVFDSAKYHYDKYAEIHKDDPINLITYYHSLANLEVWTGNLKNSFIYRHRALEQAMKAKDSAQIAAAYNTLSTYAFRFEMIDSAIYFADEFYAWSRPLQRVNYPIKLVTINPDQCERARPLLEKEVNEFKSRVPNNLWNLLDRIEDIFEATCRADTAALIKGYEQVMADEAVNEANKSSDRRELARLYILSGRYEEGRDILLQLREERLDWTAAYHYLKNTYYLALANDKLGDTEAAKEGYKEVLQYWGKADIQLEYIKKSKQNLARLTG